MERGGGCRSTKFTALGRFLAVVFPRLLEVVLGDCTRKTLTNCKTQFQFDAVELLNAFRHRFGSGMKTNSLTNFWNVFLAGLLALSLLFVPNVLRAPQQKLFVNSRNVFDFPKAEIPISPNPPSNSAPLSAWVRTSFHPSSTTVAPGTNSIERLKSFSTIIMWMAWI